MKENNLFVITMKSHTMPKSKQDGQGLMEETTKIPARGVDEH